MVQRVIGMPNGLPLWVAWLVGILACSVVAFHAYAEQGEIVGTRDMDRPSWWEISFLDLGEDAALAAEDNKHLLIYFHLRGCPYCAVMAEDNFSASNYVPFLQEHFYVVDIDIEGDREVTLPNGNQLSEREYARSLDVRFTPGILFFDGQGEQVLRVDGYRSNAQFEPIVRFVANKDYQRMNLAAYLAQHNAKRAADKPRYSLAHKPYFTQATDLTALPDKPIMLIFEDATCDECPAFHRTILEDSETRALMDAMTVIRFDALSEEPIIDHQGQATTAQDYAMALQVHYRPGIVLIDRGKVMAARDSITVLHHFQNQLAYIATRAYLRQSRQEFFQMRQQQILDSGKNIDLSL